VTPNSPATNNENLSEDNRVEVYPCTENHGLEIKTQIPFHPSPAGITERTAKEHMSNILLNTLHTVNTRVRRQKHVFSVKQVSCVDVSKEEPEEKLVLVLSFRNPHPLKDGRGRVGSLCESHYSLAQQTDNAMPLDAISDILKPARLCSHRSDPRGTWRSATNSAILRKSPPLC
jgi:hypothetical protein